ncbi:carbamoyl-phosphate synthase [Kickxella alabastrina]|uniref:carbamoyl-phosphate synthase n=1 Tax=Kickxella alabastrina TaxID=61397 RepID=UPI00221F97E0|nr:carbamoyl-phosphate synthase [Kickxella alabastrina]KAI7826833.1 carbamoyl-phosphate synthase [Kickxella alabastrina]
MSLSTIAKKLLTAHLQLRTGETFTGGSFGASVSTVGETVFTTSLVGYPESMTDPSYLGQLLVFTQPLIGNYGVPKRTRDEFGLLNHFESEKIQCRGIIVSDYAAKYSHWNAIESLSEWCAREGPAQTIDWADPNVDNLVAQASTDSVRVFNPTGDVHIALIDCGVKYNIIRSLCQQGARVSLVPWNHPTIDQIRHAYSVYQRPIFGICMGNQLMGLAAGMDVYKLRFGNRGHNQPAVDLTNGKCVITSQNHGYALDDSRMPQGWDRYYVNANDGSNEGIRHVDMPFRPLDTAYLFKEFVDQVREAKAAGVQAVVDDSVVTQKQHQAAPVQASA